MTDQVDVADNWPRDADDLVNGIPETTKAAKSMGYVPAAGNDPESQLRASKLLTGMGIEVPDGVQTGPVTPEDRRDAVRRQNEHAEETASVLKSAAGWNPVKAADAGERGEDPAVAAREAAAEDASSSDTDRQRAADERAAADQRTADERAKAAATTSGPKGRTATSTAKSNT